MSELSTAGARSLTRTRDAAAASVFEVRFTDPGAFIDDLKADADIGAVEDRIVRLAIVSKVATLEEIEAPDFVPSGHRVNPWFAAKYVTSSYQARGQLVKLSVHCGVSWVAKQEPTDFCLTKTRECAEALQSVMRQVQRPLQDLGLELRGGGVYVSNDAAPWLAHYLEAIDAAPEIHCRHCRKRIYFSNREWRHADTRRAEVKKKGEGYGGRVMDVLDHFAEPEGDLAGTPVAGEAPQELG